MKLERAFTKIYLHYWESIYRADKAIFTSQYKDLVNGLFFSTSIFLGLNGACYLIILDCYIEIIRAVIKSSKQSGRSQQMKEQIKLTTKVTANCGNRLFLLVSSYCTGTLGANEGDYSSSHSVYALCVTFVLPINSAINPYLYTIADVVSKYRKTVQDKTLVTLQSTEVIKTVSQCINSTPGHVGETDTRVWRHGPLMRWSHFKTFSSYYIFFFFYVVCRYIKTEVKYDSKLSNRRRTL